MAALPMAVSPLRRTPGPGADGPPAAAQGDPLRDSDSAPLALGGPPPPAARSLHTRLGPVAGVLLLAAVALAAQWVAHWLALPWLGGRLPFIFILPAVVLAAALWGRAAGASVLVLGLGGSVPLMQQPAAATPPGAALLLPLLLVAGIGSLLVALGARLRELRQRARAAEARLVLAIEGTGMGVFEIDLPARKVHQSPGLARHLGLPPGPLSLNRWLGSLPPPVLEAARAHLAAQAPQRRRSYEQVLQLPLLPPTPGHPGPAVEWLLLRVQVEWAGDTPVQLRAVCLDITARQRAEGALVEARRALQQRVDDLDMLHQLSSRLLALDQLQAQLVTILQMLVEAHGACAGMLAVEAADGSGLEAVAATGLDAGAREQVLAALVTTEARMQAGRVEGEAAARAVERVVVDDIAAPATPTTWRLAARLAGAQAVHAVPLVSRDDLLLGALVLLLPRRGPPTDRECRLVDICARKAAVFIERARAQAALAESARRKDEFLAMLAHELRNPLAPIRQAALLLRETDLDPDRVHWCHAVIERQVAQMATLLDDLLDVSRVTRGTLALRRHGAWLQGVVDAALETTRPLINARGHRLTLDLPAQPVPLHVDALRLSQVLGNLLANAARYTGRNGHIVLQGAVDAGGLHLSVSDDGIGIPAEGLDQVFEMFSQLQPDGDRVHGGLGIGLALSRALVELHGGHIVAHSDGPGQGSRFSLTLPPSALLAAPAAPGREPVSVPPSEPPSEPPPEPPPAPPSAPATGRAGGLRVLVADDNRDAASSLAMLLQLQGHAVQVAGDGEQALAVFERAAPQVCLLDIGMPRRDGYSVARAIRRGGGTQPLLIAVTGWGQAHDRQRALDAGFDHHLTKPVRIDRLLELVAMAPAR